MLKDAGFSELSERCSWTDKISPLGKYFVTRNGSSVIAFTVGGNWSQGNGISIVGAHTDSPTLRIKPISALTKEGLAQIGVETYGGGIWHTWFDRDLSVAGRVFVKDSEGNFVSRLVNLDKPLLRIPTLAIHLTKDRYTKFEFNKEINLRPIAGSSGCEHPAEPLSSQEFQSIQSVVSRHNSRLIEMIASQLQCSIEDIEDFELVLYDSQGATLGGMDDELIFSPRLDNLTSCYCATMGLINSLGNLYSDSGIRMISLFDHEEIGSLSAQGADSSFLPDTLNRITGDTFLETMAKSFLISSDMAHGAHPNYPEAYDQLNRPQLNMGPVIKVNANQRYVTNAAGIVLLKQLANMAKTPLQLFVVRNDSPCGSTIGPMLSGKLGIRTLDLGNPQLSMHSIRETAGAHDVEKLVLLFESFYENFTSVESKILV